MKEIRPTETEVWGLYYEWSDNPPIWYGAYESSEALLFVFDHAYRDITFGLTPKITDEEIARAREELKNTRSTESENFDLYMYIEWLPLYGLSKED